MATLGATNSTTTFPTGGAPTEQTTTSTGTQNDFSLSASYTVLRCNNATDLTLTGFTVNGSAPVAGDRVIIISIGAGNVLLSHQAAGSTAANRLINNVTSAVTPLAAGFGRAEYVYDDTTDRWRLISHEQGNWITPAFAAGDFTASGSMTWTVGSADVVTMSYYLVGAILHVVISLSDTSVGGTLSTYCKIGPAQFGNFTISTTVSSTYVVIDNGATGVMARVTANAAVQGILCYVDLNGGANFSASTNATYMQGIQLFFKVT